VIDLEAPPSPALAPQPSLVDELTREARLLLEHDASTAIVSLLSAVLVLWLLGLSLRAIARLSARLGLERSRRLWRLAHLLQLGVLVVVMGGLGKAVARIAPVWVITVIAFVLVPIALWTSGAVHDLIGGVVAQLRLRLAEADYVRIGDAAGVVTRVGLTHVELRDHAGALHRVPNRLLTTQRVELAARRRAVPVELELLTSRALTPDESAQLVDSTVTSAFRAPDTPVAVERLGSPERVRVRFSVWSQAAVEPARSKLERELARLVR
jgi:small-conductance mechanosensitive channel